MSAYACRYAIRFESMREVSGAEVEMKFLVAGASKTLTTANPDLIRRLREWNPADGAKLFLYYSDAARWDLRRPSLSAPMVDKNFQTTDEEAD